MAQASALVLLQLAAGDRRHVRGDATLCKSTNPACHHAEFNTRGEMDSLRKEGGAGAQESSVVAEFCKGFDLAHFLQQTRLSATLLPEARAELINQDTQQRVQKRDLTYGTLSTQGVQQLLRHIPMSERDIFIDLGSGAGGATAQIFCSSRISRAIGVELSEQRDALVPVRALKGGGRELSFRHANMFDVDLSEATIIFTNSIIFADETIRQLVAKLERECVPGAVILSSRMLQPFGLQRLTPSKRRFKSRPGEQRSYLEELMQSAYDNSVGSFSVESSWGDSWIHVYEVPNT